MDGGKVRRICRSRLFVQAGTAVALCVGALVAVAPASAAKRAIEGPVPATLQLGTQTLSHCASKPLAYCGKLAVPLDYSSPQSPDISIAFRWYPASVSSAAQAKGTVLPVEGGPGYPSIESVLYSSGTGQAGYAPMYGKLLERWNMLAIDNRGTGKSAPLRCPALQGYRGPTGTTAFQNTVGECGEALNHRWKYRGGGFVHASDLFTSTPAAQDMAAVIDALGLGKVDLYGDSYGSFFAQVFASRFPHLVRSVVLDSTYETSGLDPFYRSSHDSMPADFQAACSRAPACAAAESEPAWTRIGALAKRLESPIEGTVPGPGGKLEKVTLGASGLVDLVNDAAEDRQVYRDLDATARALLEEGDAAPLLRLYAQRLAVDEAYFGLPVSEYSVELYFAVGCLDYPQLFDMKAPPALRAAQLQGAVAGLAPGTYSPFTTEQWLAQDENTEAYTGCEDWPAPTIAEPPTTGDSPLLPSTTPVLVLGGELDAWTPPVDVPKVLAQVGGHARFIELANSTHVVGEGETVCGGALIEAFVAKPQDLDTMDGSCAAQVPAIHAVGVYPGSLAGEPAITPAPGSNASTLDLRMASAAVETTGDAIARFAATEATVDHGLNGGSVSAGKGGTTLTLKRDQLIPGVAVSGTVALSPAPIADDGEVAVATLTVATAGMRPASFTATWTTSGPNASAEIAGVAEGISVKGTMPAP
jgi:pimeloyl-ACP methyl ester carboxylesterase